MCCSVWGWPSVGAAPSAMGRKLVIVKKKSMTLNNQVGRGLLFVVVVRVFHRVGVVRFGLGAVADVAFELHGDARGYFAWRIGGLFAGVSRCFVSSVALAVG